MDRHQPHGTDLIGQPILFAHGQFSGLTIRAELREVQQADLGRKYARVDRRPLDPPPVVHARLFKVYNAGTDQELEKEIRNYDEIQILGLVCTVDLFPIPSPPKPPSKAELKRRAKIPTPAQQPLPSIASSSRLSANESNVRQQQYAGVFASPHTISPSQTFDGAMSSSPTHSTSSSLSYPMDIDTDPDIVHYVENYPIKESSKMTSALVGATFVQPAIIDYQGKPSIMFVFADLAVKIEGSFILRYRFFDIFSKPQNYRDLAVQAECYGGPFRVYSTKEFPGLQASTELTKQLSRWGVRLNTRETERRRRKKGEARSSSPDTDTFRKRKRSSGGADAAFDSDVDG
ncbi:hypothetical protein DXG01_015733 [Tephrocybe rancida]|nr:hypothetical protein DXG01_015733 [Tephrocybe rancida]